VAHQRGGGGLELLDSLLFLQSRHEQGRSW
jgi:hypothetical protein